MMQGLNETLAVPARAMELPWKGSRRKKDDETSVFVIAGICNSVISQLLIPIKWCHLAQCWAASSPALRHESPAVGMYSILPSPWLALSVQSAAHQQCIRAATLRSARPKFKAGTPGIQRGGPPRAGPGTSTLPKNKQWRSSIPPTWSTMSPEISADWRILADLYKYNNLYNTELYIIG